MDWLKDLFGSKKWRTMLIGIVLDILIATNLIELDPEVKIEAMAAITSLIGIFIGAQGFADRGKEAIKEEEKIRKERGNETTTPSN